MSVPFLDLKAQYETIRDEIAEALQSVFEAAAFTSGSFVEQFEREFASFCQCRHGVGVSSGTAALWTALSGLGIGKKDQVITVSNTFVATMEAICSCGAKPVPVDVDEATYNMNPALLEAAITPRTRAIIPVHLFGQMADMDPIMEIARAHKLFVIQGAVLSVKLRHLPVWNEARRGHAKLYYQLLAGVHEIILPRLADHMKHIYHIFPLRVKNRDAFIATLAERGIQCGVHYPVPIHLQRAFRFLGLGRGTFPVAERCAEELVSLPVFPELTQAQIERVVGEIKRFVA